MSVPTLVVLVPVLDRPHRVLPLCASFVDSMIGENIEASMLFLANPEDELEICELRYRNQWLMIVPWANGPRDYTRKMQYGVERTDSDWILFGADDLFFHRGWFRAALNAHITTGKLVVGTNDLANPLVQAGKHATHPLIHRDYVARGTIDNPDVILHPEYNHNSVDVEFCETAISRNEFVFAPDSRVEHQHPTFDKRVKRDRTYQKGMRFALVDRKLMLRRRHLWDPSAPRRPNTVQARPTLTRARPDPSGYWPPR